MQLFKALPWSHKDTVKVKATSPGPLARTFRRKFSSKKHRQVQEEVLSVVHHEQIGADAQTARFVGDVNLMRLLAEEFVRTRASPEITAPSPSVEPKPDVAPIPGPPSTLGPSVGDPLLPPSTYFSAFVSDARCQPTTDDYIFSHTLGAGRAGLAVAAIGRRDGKLYKVKVLRKEALSKAQFARIFMSQYVMETMKGTPFTVDLQAAFETTKKFFFVSPLHSGNLRSEMDTLGRFSEEDARFIIAQLVVALESLHGKRIVHRHINPINILLTTSGNLILSDFTLAHAFGRSVEEQPWRVAGVPDWQLPEDVDPEGHREAGGGDVTNCFRGTLDYMAPEMFATGGKQGWHSYPADVWSVGVLLYELLNHQLPFYMSSKTMESDTRLERAPLTMFGDFSDEVRDLIKRLLEKDPDLRPGWTDVKNHPWFRGFDWNAVVPQESPSVPEEIRNLDLGELFSSGDKPHPYFSYTAPDHSVPAEPDCNAISPPAHMEDKAATAAVPVTIASGQSSPGTPAGNPSTPLKQSESIPLSEVIQPLDAPSPMLSTPECKPSSSESAAAASSRGPASSAATVVGSTVSVHGASTDSSATHVDADSSFSSSRKPWMKKLLGSVKRYFKPGRRRAEKPTSNAN